MDNRVPGWFLAGKRNREDDEDEDSSFSLSLSLSLSSSRATKNGCCCCFATTEAAVWISRSTSSPGAEEPRGTQDSDRELPGKEEGLRVYAEIIAAAVEQLQFWAKDGGAAYFRITQLSR